MCLAIPKKIIKIINKQKAIVKFDDQTEEIDISLVAVKPGVYVLTHAAIAVRVLPEQDVAQILGLLSSNTAKIKA